MTKFDKIFKSETIGVSNLLLLEINKELPNACKYEYDEEQGSYVLNLNQANITGLEIVYPEEFLLLNNQKKNFDDLIKYCNNSMTPIVVKCIDGENFFVDGIKINKKNMVLNSYGFSYLKEGTFYILPNNEDIYRYLTISYANYKKEIKLERKPIKSVSDSEFSYKEQGFEFVMKINDKTKALSFSMNYNFLKASSIDDAICITVLYWAFINKKIKINDVCLYDLNFRSKTKLDSNNTYTIEYLLKLKILIDRFNLQIDFPLENISDEDVKNINILYETLVEKLPVKIKNNSSITLTFKDEPEKLDLNMVFAYSFFESKNIIICGANIRLYKFSLFVNLCYDEQYVEEDEIKVRLKAYDNKGSDEFLMYYFNEEEAKNVEVDDKYLKFISSGKSLNEIIEKSNLFNNE